MLAVSRPKSTPRPPVASAVAGDVSDMAKTKKATAIGRRLGEATARVAAVVAHIASTAQVEVESGSPGEWGKDFRREA